jgi:uncharacterized protein YbjT (DUF2867 family)
MTKKTIAVMGATGHIGTTLSELLLSKGHDVRALGRDAKKLGALAAKGAKARSVAFTDPTSLAESFAGADAVFVMIPPSYGEPDFAAYQDRQADAIAKGLQKAGIHKVVSLSSVGAQQPGGTGPIAGLGRMEKRLNQSGGPDVIHLRPSYFMENHSYAIPVIKGMGICGSPIKPDLPFSQIATKDIAAKAAELLDRQDFKGSSVLELAGPRELTMTESTAILGKSIGKPDLKYVQFPYPDAEKAFLGMGMPPSTAALMVDMYRGLNEGRVVYEKPITASQRTKTSLEEFAGVFAGAFQAG